MLHAVIYETPETIKEETIITLTTGILNVTFHRINNKRISPYIQIYFAQLRLDQEKHILEYAS